MTTDETMGERRKDNGHGDHLDDQNLQATPSVNYSQTVSFLATTPPAITRLLTTLAPIIFFLSYLLDCLTWNGGRHSGPGGGRGRGGGPASWLIVVGWWLVCGVGPEVWAYGINGVVLFLMGVTYLRRTRRQHIEEKLGKGAAGGGAIQKRTGSRTIHTSQALLDAAVTHLDHISRLTGLLLSEIIAPLLYAISWENRTITLTLFRLSLTMWPLIILGAWYIPFSTRIVVGCTGTLVLVWTAPWFRILRRVLWRSATIRFMVRSLLFLLNGFHPVRGIPPRAPFSLRALFKRNNDATTMTAGQRRKTGPDESVLVFQFILYENQRWWVGLDWTAALLPQERPPWADEHNNPVSPPSSFTLPPPTRSVFPDPNGPAIDSKVDKSEEKANGTSGEATASGERVMAIERRVEWEWIDPEWHVVKSPLEIDQVHQAEPYSHAGGTAGGRSGARPDEVDESESDDEDDVQARRGAAEAPKTGGGNGSAGPASDFAQVDDDGWVYSNNSWSASSSKPGFRKYTRRRRWTRKARAVEVEKVVKVDRSEVGISQ